VLSAWTLPKHHTTYLLADDFLVKAVIIFLLVQSPQATQDLKTPELLPIATAKVSPLLRLNASRHLAPENLKNTKYRNNLRDEIERLQRPQ
jgi:hypothetical protein